jgi:energy-coupling factor transporter ATP-binding protein EcfA2
MERETAIAVTGLRRAYGEQEVLAGIDLRVPRGTVYALLGPNGAGKTTTVQILSTLLAPDGGSAHVLGHDVVTEAGAVRAAIGVTGQVSAVDGRREVRCERRQQCGGPIPRYHDTVHGDPRKQRQPGHRATVASRSGRTRPPFAAHRPRRSAEGRAAQGPPAPRDGGGDARPAPASRPRRMRTALVASADSDPRDDRGGQRHCVEHGIGAHGGRRR